MLKVNLEKQRDDGMKQAQHIKCEKAKKKATDTGTATSFQQAEKFREIKKEKKNVIKRNFICG